MSNVNYADNWGDIVVEVHCPKCGDSTTEWLDSIPYCPKCGKPMVGEEVGKIVQGPNFLKG